MAELRSAKFTFLGHACVRCDLPDGRVLVVDPWLTGNPAAPKGVTFDRLDVILVTHAHDDHMADVVPLAKRFDALVVAGYDLCGWIASQGVRRTSGMNIGGTQEIDGIRVTQVRADHTSSFIDGDGRIIYGGVATGFVVKLPGGCTFYHSGDTGLFSDMSLVGDLWRPEIAFLPIGDHFTMDPEQAARACRLTHVQWVIPIHHGTFPLLTGTPADLARALHDQGSPTRVVALAPGESWSPPA